MAGTQSTLPISAPSGQAAAAGGGGGGGAGVLTATPAARAFFGRLSEGARNALAQRRPWLELVDRNSLAKPESLSEATTRIRKNWTYFRINYMILLSGVLAFSLVSHPVSLFLLAVLLGGWIFLYLFRTEPLVVLNRTYGDKEVLGIMSVLTIVIVFLTSVGSLLISALMVGLAIVCAHGAFRVPEDLFLDEQEPTVGFLSFLGGGAPQPSIVSHV